jgi:pimeloyl-ACP methyl ester carboxylesterase
VLLGQDKPQSAQRTTKSAPQVGGAEELFVRISGVRVRYLFRQCAGSSPKSLPIVLVHGLLGFSYSWRHNIGPLSQTADVYALDLPGAGYSDRPRRFNCSLRGFSNFLLQFAHELRLSAFDLVGTSHGGAIALMAAAADIAERGLDQRQIRKLVLAAPVNPWSWGNPLLTRLFGSRLGGLCSPLAYPFLLRMQDVALRRVYGDPTRIQAGVANTYSQALVAPGTRAHLVRVLRSWHSDLNVLRESLETVRQIPTLLIWGTRDAAVLPSSAEPLAQCFDNVQVKMIEGAGHLPYEETPEEFNAAALAFLRPQLQS